MCVCIVDKQYFNCFWFKLYLYSDLNIKLMSLVAAATVSCLVLTVLSASVWAESSCDANGVCAAEGRAHDKLKNIEVVVPKGIYVWNENDTNLAFLLLTECAHRCECLWET